MSDRIAEIAAAKVAEGTWLTELEDTIAGLEAELEQVVGDQDRQRLSQQLATRRDQLDKRRAYMATLPRIDIGEGDR